MIQKFIDSWNNPVKSHSKRIKDRIVIKLQESAGFRFFQADFNVFFDRLIIMTGINIDVIEIVIIELIQAVPGEARANIHFSCCYLFFESASIKLFMRHASLFKIMTPPKTDVRIVLVEIIDAIKLFRL